MDIELTISVVLWVSAFAAIVSFLVAISATVVVRKGSTVNSESNKKDNVMEDSVIGNVMMAAMADAEDDTIEKGWDSTKMVVGVGSSSVVSAILSGVTESQFSSVERERYQEEGRMHVRQWDIAFSRGEWDWNLLRQAVECYVKAIGYDSNDQHSWTNLAFVYHLIGDKDKALQCLGKSHDLAGSSPYGPGRDYQQVEMAVKGGATLLGEKLNRPPIPALFRDEIACKVDALEEDLPSFLNSESSR
ncbi:MAG: hypothetical protein BECKG1743D_GA0114223_103451 [Candidatus Kentron sp. G]|nr:MAG: hypothetical protein BECKG1743F_GA0114225_103552 [Candidatus Kentron sp. G]VFN00513.1 MAG: hypothetical protein BECKG1743E_GA0114224_103284 [Candidatus Kentron sp. G]VFN02197.1 MAG: hypothetical protein BECKG1743D_GA0114223_103451 [Candidatus Kentron sp. G]